MGRHKKEVLTLDGVDRRENGYYSTPKFVSDFLSKKMLEINSGGSLVLDPCVGKEEMLDVFYEQGKEIESIDIVDYGVHSKSNFAQQDFFALYGNKVNETVFGLMNHLPHDFYIANPPYNCHETEYIQKNKSQLLGLFPDVGVANMYAMFISSIINLAKEGAVIGLITLDSFLTAKMHEGLRRQILRECSIHYLLLCPTDLFLSQKADIRTCLLILQKGKQYQGTIHTLNRTLNTQEFIGRLDEGCFEKNSISEIVLSDSRDNLEFTIGSPKEITTLFQLPRLGEKYQCITGISTGNDGEYISRTKDDKYTIPFYKNPASRRFFTEPDGYLPSDFLEIEKKVKTFMVRNKKLLFKEGITCSSMGVQFTACYLPPNSTYGVNPNIICDKEDIWWLMSYLNSSLVMYMVRGVLIRSNMITSGYLSRIPVIEFSLGEKTELARISQHVYTNKINGNIVGKYLSEIDDIVFGAGKITDETKKIVLDFCKNPIRYS
ncbi:MAG: N-6 DNA methylase [Leptospiraceae bacterium]|nr:N-6 DNA methylase [Leptospiraceae bacterium]